MKSYVASFLLLVACGGGGGGGTIDAAPDSKVFMDGPPNVPAMITISGTAVQQSSSGGTPTPVQGSVVAAFKNDGSTTPITMATTDAQGKFSLTVMTGGMPVDGYLKATKTGNADTYLYPPAPLIADFPNAPVNEIDTSTFALLMSLGGGMAGQGAVVLIVQDSAAMPVAGAVVTSTPKSAKTGYSKQGSALPDFMGTATIADGRAYLTGLPVGNVSLTATKSGVTFRNHSVGSFADSLTTTVISE